MPRTTRAVKDEAFSALSAEYQVAAHELNRRLVDGEIPVSVWRNGLQEQIKTLHVQAYVAGRSGEWDAVTQAEWGRVGQRLRTQYEYLRNWSLELAGPGLDNVSLAKLNVRADLYAAAARASFESAIAEEKGTPSGVLPAMPGDGTSRCLVRCKCGWAIRKRGRSQFATWRLGRAEHCDTCLARARSWKNLEIRDGVLVTQYEPIFYNR